MPGRSLGAILLVAALASGCAARSLSDIGSDYRQARIHVVEKGDTLFSIASSYGVSMSAIKRRNDLKDNMLQVGQKLVIPLKSSPKRYSPGRSLWGNKDKEPPKKSGSAPKKENLPPVKAPKIDIDLAWPVKEKGTVTSGFGVRENGKHDGIDISAPRGTPICAAADGTVLFSGPGPTGYGLTVLIKHTDNIFTVYSHNDKNTVKKGAKVKQGDQIATVGKTGRATGDHLHFEVRVNRVAYNPRAYLPGR